MLANPHIPEARVAVGVFQDRKYTIPKPGATAPVERPKNIDNDVLIEDILKGRSMRRVPGYPAKSEFYVNMA